MNTSVLSATGLWLTLMNAGSHVPIADMIGAKTNNCKYLYYRLCKVKNKILIINKNHMTKNLVALAEMDDHDCDRRQGKFCLICNRRERWLRFRNKMDMVRARMENPQPDLRVWAAIAGRVPEDEKT
jgi:hypothetical protein